MASSENGKSLQDFSDPPEMHFSAVQSSDPGFIFVEGEKLDPLKIEHISIGQGGKFKEWIGTVQEFPDGGRETINLRAQDLNFFLGNKSATGCFRSVSKEGSETIFIRNGEVVFRNSVGNGHSPQLVPQLDFFGAVDGHSNKGIRNELVQALVRLVNIHKSLTFKLKHAYNYFNSR